MGRKNIIIMLLHYYYYYWKKHYFLMVFIILLLRGKGVESFIGVNWGRFATQNLVPSIGVDLLLQNGISHLRMFSPKTSVLVAFEGSPTAIAITVMKDFIMRSKWTNIKTFDNFIETFVQKPIKSGVNITTLIVTHEPFTKIRPILWNLTDVFKQVRDSLDNHNLTYVKTTTSHFTDVITTTSKPSEAEFRPDIKHAMHRFLKTMSSSNNSFFTYNIFPITSIEERKWPVEFGFMDNRSNFTVVDGNYTYTNAFEFLYDALVVALEKSGHPDMEIQIGQIGWPTDGSVDSTVRNAERFYRGLLTHIAENKGTPRRPNKTIDVYLNSLTDENLNLVEYGAYQRHFGIYSFDGIPKFPIDFTGKRRNIYPTKAEGAVKMPNRWCVLTRDVTNKTLVEEQVKFACNTSDCTELLPGASCEKLDFAARASYAFNAFYQKNNQELKEGACWFEGLAGVTLIEPSVGNCNFPVGLLTAEVVDDGKQVPQNVFKYIDSTGYSGSATSRTLQSSLHLSVALPLLCIIFLLAVIK